MKSKRANLPVNIFFLIFSLGFIIPFILIISSSITDEQTLITEGYKLIPHKFSLEAYKYVMKSPGQLLNSYKVTIFYSLVATAFSMVVMTLMAYPLSRSSYKYKKPVTFFIIFTMLFSGGLIPTYILMTKYLHLQDNIWVYILPNLANAFHIIVIRSFFQGLPPSLVESAKIDGARELQVFYKIVLPLSKPVIATVSLLNLLARWNDWNTALIYIRSKELFSLQYLLQQILREVQFIKDMAESSPVAGISINLTQLPSETIRFALCIVAAGPMLIIFPFFQKYFAKGLTVGAVKE
ncbi:carbohydrate ABC transporter permease [Anaerocolumna sp. AGMB13020]|uniref:carbohydrate ABC transporter permease n=1 Tax=Anaerocolumna sp. AGMB13020 TaxID=3081750 RepID=UPI002955A40B|nr:carbohydrate ABC transporter permease [Anaerocolumna sp. AGMB13020]WOO37738.1 carbohydrate ABC transporter permease [Anaerocolumna sp. AGMB13020]